MRYAQVFCEIGRNFKICDKAPYLINWILRTLDIAITVNFRIFPYWFVVCVPNIAGRCVLGLGYLVGIHETAYVWNGIQNLGRVLSNSDYMGSTNAYLSTDD